MWLRVLRWMMLATVMHNVKAEEWDNHAAPEWDNHAAPEWDNRADPPSLEFLDYLGSMIETDGELIGPDVFQETEITRDEPSVMDALEEEVIYRD